MDPDIHRAATALRSRLGDTPVETFVVLGSGLSSVADRLEDPTDVPIGSLPGMASSTVPGHRGMLRHGHLGNRHVLIQQGRLHLYEGLAPKEVTRSVHVAAELGARTMILTNAAGGLDPSLSPGDLMVISDQLNLTGTSPLLGMTGPDGPLFVDMSEAYDPQLRALAHEVAEEQGDTLAEGVYAGVLGPAYETPAEVEMLRTLGGSAVGMSTVLEVIAARAAGMRVLGISSITNVHKGHVPTSHEEVLEVGAGMADRVADLVTTILSRT